jgi:NAD(P)-dependent dehydrogenase (short-subunit alcohol dehydrogenase family)
MLEPGPVHEVAAAAERPGPSVRRSSAPAGRAGTRSCAPTCTMCCTRAPWRRRGCRPPAAAAASSTSPPSRRTGPHRAAPGFAVYAAAKAAVEQFARTLAVELAPDGIRVNNVAPDYVPTSRIAGIASADGGMSTDTGGPHRHSHGAARPGQRRVELCGVPRIGTVRLHYRDHAASRRRHLRIVRLVQLAGFRMGQSCPGAPAGASRSRRRRNVKRRALAQAGHRDQPGRTNVTTLFIGQRLR